MYSGTSKASNVHLTFVVNRILTLQLNKMELVIMKLCPVPESFNTLPKLSSFGTLSLWKFKLRISAPMVALFAFRKYREFYM